MLRSTIISSLIVLFFGQFLIAQDIDLDIKRTVYNRYNIVGAQANTNGFGAMYRYGKRITGFKNHLFTATVANFKYAKEEKFYSSVVNSKGYYYGKINSLFFFRLTYGKQIEKFSKELKRGVAVSYLWNVGLSNALLKPYYIKVIKSLGDATTRYTEPFNPEDPYHNQIYITGPGAFYLGLSRLGWQPGLNLNGAVNFEYSPRDAGVSAVEIGFNLDAFYNTLPVLAYTNQNRVFLTFYATAFIGSKKF